MNKMHVIAVGLGLMALCVGLVARGQASQPPRPTVGLEENTVVQLDPTSSTLLANAIGESTTTASYLPGDYYRETISTTLSVVPRNASGQPIVSPAILAVRVCNLETVGTSRVACRPSSHPAPDCATSGYAVGFDLRPLQCETVGVRAGNYLQCRACSPATSVRMGVARYCQGDSCPAVFLADGGIQ